MTSRELYNYALIELNKLEAPTLLLEDYNYFINKAIQQYINIVYSKYEIDQQSTDDIRSLKASTILQPKQFTNENLKKNGLYNSSYYVDLPADYMHLLSCIVEYSTDNSCKSTGKETEYFSARKITGDMYSQIIRNAYMKPSYIRPYYNISNINDDFVGETRYNKPGDTRVNISTEQSPIMKNKGLSNDERLTPTNSEDYNILNYNGTGGENSYVDDDVTKYYLSNLVNSKSIAGDRFANPSKVRIELKMGEIPSGTSVEAVYVDYIKAPMYVKLTEEQIQDAVDNSQILEFSDYVCLEIVNILVRLLMENNCDPRLQTVVPINSTINGQQTK